MSENLFRKNYRELSADEQAQLGDIKQSAECLLEEIAVIRDGREKSLAITKLEECVMWAVKGITG